LDIRTRTRFPARAEDIGCRPRQIRNFNIGLPIAADDAKGVERRKKTVARRRACVHMRVSCVHPLEKGLRGLLPQLTRRFIAQMFSETVAGLFFRNARKRSAPGTEPHRGRASFTERNGIPYPPLQYRTPRPYEWFYRQAPRRRPDWNPRPRKGCRPPDRRSSG